jgi:hypothetical protein
MYASREQQKYREYKGNTENGKQYSIGGVQFKPESATIRTMFYWNNKLVPQA